MAMADFLKDLPTRNADNFTKINPDSCHRSSTGKKTAYVPVKDIPSDQVIVTEKTNILLRYLHQQWDKKAGGTKKRTGDLLGEVEFSASKKPRLETIPDMSNTPGPSSNTGAGRSTGVSASYFNIPGESPNVPPPAYPGTSGNMPVNRFANQQ